MVLTIPTNRLRDLEYIDDLKEDRKFKSTGLDCQTIHRSVHSTTTSVRQAAARMMCQQMVLRLAAASCTVVTCDASCLPLGTALVHSAKNTRKTGHFGIAVSSLRSAAQFPNDRVQTCV